MRLANARICTAIAAFALLVTAVPRGYAQQKTPSLAELARKEQERRKALKAEGKVLTKDDLPKATQPPAAPAAAPAGEAGAPAGAATAPSAEQKPEQKPTAKPEEEKGEAWWRQRITQARDELRRNEMFAEALQTRINALTNDFASRDDPYQRARIADDRQKAMAEFDRVRADIELQKKKIGDIEEEARRANVPPGWLR